MWNSYIFAPWEYLVPNLFYLMVLMLLNFLPDMLLCWGYAKWWYSNAIISFHKYLAFFCKAHAFSIHFIFKWKSCVACGLVTSYNRRLIRKVGHKWNVKIWSHSLYVPWWFTLQRNLTVNLFFLFFCKASNHLLISVILINLNFHVGHIYSTNYWVLFMCQTL